ncbi:Polygalacturonase [hydrothermal vent metagenome]|uniref:Polygalacturonase n=1 Tax=hydrothermal vent metagenome TaxID=652676 RepID=A0A3B1CGD6_9ZZZZ
MKKKGQYGFIFVAVFIVNYFIGCSSDSKINRKELVTRHNPTITKVDSMAVFSVGNGEFAFTAGITGLQTFNDYYDNGIPLNTMSHWGWHSFTNPKKIKLEDAIKYYDSHGRKVGYASNRSVPAAEWLRQNPHRLDLGKIGFILKKSDGSRVDINELKNVKQTLNMWTGILTSYFEIEDKPVEVETVCHGDLDAISFRVKSPLINSGQLEVVFHFPYGSGNWGPVADDWSKPSKHETKIVAETKNSIDLKRTLDNMNYFVDITWSGNNKIVETEKHKFILTPGKTDVLEFTCRFSKNKIIDAVPSFDETELSSTNSWYKFWTEGGAIELSKSKDKRAVELERRIVLSQYLLKINSSGSFLPAETGLTCNSWYGKPHLEMHWWHDSYAALWGREDILAKSMPWYKSILDKARMTAKFQGYDGVRWPKMVGPDGREGPSSVAVFLIWQQPHPIYYAELLYRLHPNKETLEKYKELVFQSAEFMASYAYWDKKSNRYVLGPPLIPAQEKHPAETTMNPTFELAYWAWGLETAQQWRVRLGMGRNEVWQHVLDNLSQLPVKDGLYVNAETAMNTFGKGGKRYGHPSLLGAYGMIPPNSLTDSSTMHKTLKKVMETWNWESTWGWDFPLTAMTAARLGEQELAIQALLMDSKKNNYLVNGHNYQTSNLPIYLPGNGGLLSAVAMMAAGWDGAPGINAPGFPQDGSWTVRWEGLKRMP